MKNFFYPIVELFWKDHYSLGDEWYDEMADQPVRILSAVGYLVNEDEDYYYVACNFDFGGKQFSAGTAVLKNCVTKRRVLSKGRFDYDQFTGKRTPCENCEPLAPPRPPRTW
jgi:hypothetical protein